jgi:signal transduction histidine kinase
LRANAAPVVASWPQGVPSLAGDGELWRERIELVAMAARTQALYRSAVQVFAACTPEDLHKAILSAVRSLVRVDLAALFLVRDKDGRPVCRALHTDRSTLVFGANEAPTAAFADAALATPARSAVAASDALLCDLAPSLNGAHHPTTLLSVPVRSGKDDMGVLVAGRRLAIPFSSDQVDLLCGLADQAALALEKLRATEAAAEQGRRAQEFVSVASHELRTPLTALQGFSELLLSREVSPDVQKNWLSLINQESVRLGSLIAELLDLTRLESGRAGLSLEQVKLEDLVEHVLSLWAGNGQRSRFSVNVQPGVPRLKADSCKLTQVLANLVGNAVNYSSPGSPISIDVAPRCLARPHTTHLGLTTEGGAPCPAVASIAVHDRGVGISREDQARVFQPFWRVASQQEEDPPAGIRTPSGSGLGLTIARRLVEWHGGLMWVESCPGRGSTFGFCLPTHPPHRSASGTPLDPGDTA